jgi:hypothetical protein
MIIDDLDVFGACVSPTKTDAKLIVDPDAILARANPLGISRRLPGGIRRSSNRPAISTCRSLRRATAAMFENRLTGIPFASA